MPHVLHVDPRHQPVFRELAIDAETLFDHELVKPWRSLADRENCLLETTLADGRKIRWHVKRYAPVRGQTPADAEVAGYRLLRDRQLPTADLVAWGRLEDGRSFVILEDLAGYADAEKLVAGGLPFDRLLEPTADLAARLHGSGLHHRDLYLCHFFARVGPDRVDVRLIDVARVRKLPRWLARRWVVKDLAQFWHSTTGLPISEGSRLAWLSRYARQRGIEADAFLSGVRRKARWIARHDAALRKRQPRRNISVPSEPSA